MTPAPASTPPLTLQQLLDEPSLGLAVVEAGDLSRPVRGAHTMEIDQPARWLASGWVMLTTGFRFVGLPDRSVEHARLVDDLVSAGVPALLFGVGVHFAEVPRGLAEAARKRGLTLLRIAAGTPFITVEDFVNRALVAGDSALLKRALWLHNDLLRALAENEPVNALIARLAMLSRGTAVLYDGTGTPLAATGEGPLRLIWQEICAREDVPQQFPVGRYRVVTRPFQLDGSRFHLALASRTGSLVGELGPTVLETSEHLLGAANSMRALTMSHERMESARIVSALRAGLTSSRVRQTWDRMRPFRFRAGGRLRMVAAGPWERQREQAWKRPFDVLLEAAHEAGLGVLLAEDDDPDDGAAPLTAVVAEQDGSAGWVELMGRTHLVGVSEVFDDLTEAAHYYQDAVTAWKLAARRSASGASGTVVRLDEVDLATWVMARRDDVHVADRVNRYTAPLAESPDLVDTLVTYLACHQDVKATAQRLFLHSNTVRYRLGKVELALGVDIRSTAALANLYLALQDRVEALAGDARTRSSSAHEGPRIEEEAPRARKRDEHGQRP